MTQSKVERLSFQKPAFMRPVLQAIAVHAGTMAIALGMIYMVEILFQSLLKEDRFDFFNIVPLHFLFRASVVLLLLSFILATVIDAVGIIRERSR